MMNIVKSFKEISEYTRDPAFCHYDVYLNKSLQMKILSDVE